MADNRDHSKDSVLQLVDGRLDCRDPRVGGHLAASTAGGDHRASAMHRHVAGAFLLGRCHGQTWQEASQDRRHRPKQDGTNRKRHTNSAHNQQSRLLGSDLQSVRTCNAELHQLAYSTDLREWVAVILITSGSSVSHSRRYVVPEVPEWVQRGHLASIPGG